MDAVDAPAPVRLPMVCACGLRGAELDDKIRSHMDDYEYGSRSTQLLHLLNLRGYHVNTVPVRTWLAVVARSWRCPVEHPQVSVECDRFEDGLVAILEHVSTYAEEIE